MASTPRRSSIRLTYELKKLKVQVDIYKDKLKVNIIIKIKVDIIGMVKVKVNGSALYKGLLLVEYTDDIGHGQG